MKTFGKLVGELVTSSGTFWHVMRDRRRFLGYRKTGQPNEIEDRSSTYSVVRILDESDSMQRGTEHM